MTKEIQELARGVVIAHQHARQTQYAAAHAEKALRDAARSLATAIYKADSFKGPGLVSDSTSFVVNSFVVTVDLDFNETDRDLLECVRISSQFPDPSQF